MMWEYDSQFVESNKLQQGMKEANERGKEGWEVVDVVGVVGKGTTSGGNYIPETTGYRFFYKRQR